jgi:hypothetical protein
MTALEMAREMGHEEVILVQDAAAGRRAVIAEERLAAARKAR